MIEYNDLNDDEKRILREKLGISRMSNYYLEDNNILLMNKKELFEYVFLFDIKKCKDAINLITSISDIEIAQNDIGKSVSQILLENRSNVIKINNNIYAYKENL